MRVFKKQLMERIFQMNAMQREAVFQVNGPLSHFSRCRKWKNNCALSTELQSDSYGNAYQSQEVSDAIDEQDINEMKACLENNQLLSDELPEETFRAGL